VEILLSKLSFTNMKKKKTSDTYSHKGTLILIHKEAEYLMLNTTIARENG
jgi:hypothetical protein